MFHAHKAGPFKKAAQRAERGAGMQRQHAHPWCMLGALGEAKAAGPAGVAGRRRGQCSGVWGQGGAPGSLQMDA